MVRLTTSLLDCSMWAAMPAAVHRWQRSFTVVKAERVHPCCLGPSPGAGSDTCVGASSTTSFWCSDAKFGLRMNSGPCFAIPCVYNAERQSSWQLKKWPPVSGLSFKYKSNRVAGKVDFPYCSFYSFTNFIFLCISS